MRAPRELKQLDGDAVGPSNRRFADAAARGDARAMASVYTNDADFLLLYTHAALRAAAQNNGN